MMHVYYRAQVKIMGFWWWLGYGRLCWFKRSAYEFSDHLWAINAASKVRDRLALGDVHRMRVVVDFKHY